MIHILSAVGRNFKSGHSAAAAARVRLVCAVEALLRLEPAHQPGSSLKQPTGLFLDAQPSFWFKPKERRRKKDIFHELLRSKFLCVTPHLAGQVVTPPCISV